jgi:hypothetical protein
MSRMQGGGGLAIARPDQPVMPVGAGAGRI